MAAVFPWMDPVAGFIRFLRESTGTCYNRQPYTVTGSLHRILTIFRRDSCQILHVSSRFSQEMHGNTAARKHRPGYIYIYIYIYTTIWHKQLLFERKWRHIEVLLRKKWNVLLFYIFGITVNDPQEKFLALQRSRLGLLNIIFRRLNNKVQLRIDHQMVDLAQG